ncbi:porin family protein [Rasiella rasia]|uniref:Porin family protein n=1 Tax=Rasiella rasia TaxID=2744027 RepID=A0A6G6GIP4_9FLAO|nr:porin family protein [Rasiella rasia]QIE58370.1 porin family protein [Rasiella rasia]
MRKWILIFIAVVGVGISAEAQEEKNAIGLRLGDSDGFGTEVSYQRYLTEKNRLEIDLGWRSSKNFDAFRLTGLYQWVWNIDGGFNWYAGPGAGIAQVDFDDVAPGFDDSETYVYLAGDIGIEYDFDFPLLLSLDFRPEFGFSDNLDDDIDFDIALGVRYQF